MFDQHGPQVGSVKTIVDGQHMGAGHTENELDAQALHVSDDEFADG